MGADATNTNQIGVAPGAKFIACRNMDTGEGTPARYIECMEWFLAPYPIGGTPAQGDPAKGAAHFFIKFVGGFAAPLHHHSSDHYVNVVAGTVVLTVDGKDNKLPTGSFFSFTGKKQHVTKCEGTAECLLFVDSRGKWDIVPEETKPAAKKDEANPAAKK